VDAPNRSLFISSCTRRQMARRRPSRAALRLQLTLVALVLAAAAGAFIALRVGL
jgi:hypothetical protein